MLRTLLAVILALAVSAAGAQIVNRPVAAGSISNPGTSLPATCAVGYVYFKSNSTAGQNLHLCTAANTWTQMTGGNLANPVTPAQGGSGVANSKNLTWSASLTLAGTDSTTMTFPTTSASIARTDAANTFTGTQTFSGQVTSTKTGNGSSSAAYVNGAGNTSIALRDSTQALDAKLWDISVGIDANTLRFRLINDAEGVAPSWLVVTRAAAAASSIQFPIPDFIIGSSSIGPARLRTAQQTAPTCTTNCGTSPSVAGTDSAGIITMGASGVPASGFVLTFNGTWSAAPACMVTMYLAGMVVGKQPLTVATTTTTFTVVTNGTAPSTSDKYAYHCIGVS